MAVFRIGMGISTDHCFTDYHHLIACPDVLNGCGDGLSSNIDDGVVNERLLDGILESAETGHWVKLR